jgi:hypothetical protein
MKVPQELAPAAPDLPKIDDEQIFLLYATFCGDVDRTAAAVNLEPARVFDLAVANRWNDKLKGILDLKKSGNPGDIERAINRAINFVQAHQYRRFLARMMARITGLNQDEVDELTMQDITDKWGVHKAFNLKPLADLATALEKCHQMSYAALDDSTAARKTRTQDEEPDEVSASSVHAEIAKALAANRAGAVVEVEQNELAAALTGTP